MRHFEQLPFRQRASIRPIPRALALLAAAPLVAHAAGALPNGGHFVAGSGAISANGTSVTINQSTNRGIVDWTSFSIANGNRVTFNNGNGATLNRVTGGDPSVIMGMLTGSGSVYLVNPQGVVVSPSGIISTGGRFVASTLDTDNAAFMAGGDLRFTGSSKAQIVNLGKIGSSQGDVFLIAADEIDNFGTISAPNGTAELTVGQHMLLRDSATGNQVSVLVGSGGTVLNRGAVEAAQINLQAVDGNVFALSGNHAAVRATGTATRAGHVWLVAGNGIVKISNPVEAKNADGSGGIVDTSAAALAFGLSPSVLAGVWNIATPTFTIDAAAAAMFSRSLAAGTSINLQTTGAYGRTGDIDVAKTIDWSGSASLTLGAYRNVSVEKGVVLRNEGTGNLTLRADTTAIDNGASVFNAGTVDWSRSTGIVSLLYDMNGSYSPGTLLSNASWASPLYSGLVTQITGYKLINSGADLQNVDNDLAGNYALGKDLDMTNAGFNTLADPNNNRNTPWFTGQFDGMWHTISNLSPNDISLFFFQSGTIRDLYVNAQTSGEMPFFSAGILADFNAGTIANVFTSGVIAVPYGFATTLAGLVGENSGLIARSGSSAGVGGDLGSAGLVGNNSGGTIVESYVTGGVGSSSIGTVGGLVLTNGGTIKQSYVSGQVSNLNPNNAGGAICDGCSGVSNDVYWNVQTTGYTSSGSNLPASNGLTTAQMSNPASFSGWDFGPNGAWAMPAGSTQPVLRWQIEHPSGGTPPGVE